MYWCVAINVLDVFKVECIFLILIIFEYNKLCALKINENECNEELKLTNCI